MWNCCKSFTGSVNRLKTRRSPFTGDHSAGTYSWYFPDCSWHPYPCCITHIMHMHVLVSLLPEHYKCRLIFYRNVRDDFMSCKIFKTGDTRLPATVCLNTGVARNVKLTTIRFPRHFPDLCHIPWHFQVFQTSYRTTTTTVLRPFFRDHPGEPVPEENFCTLWCKGRLTEADTPTIRLGATPSGLTSAHLQHPPHSFLQAGCPSCRPTNSVKALKATFQTS